jgi:hypothetical protein
MLDSISGHKEKLEALLPMTTERKILMTLEKEQIINALEV